MMPEVSVIIPCYNVEEDMLKRCLNSVLNQTFENYEIIVVDDGSTSTYESVLQNARKWDRRIKILKQDNQGVSAARNKGVKEAKGKYIVFLDADDAFLPEFLSEAFTLCVDKEIDFLIGGNVSLYSELWGKRNVNDPIVIEKIDSKSRSCLIKNLVGALRKFGKLGGYIGRGPWTRFIKREIAEKIMFDETLRKGEDIEWNIRILNESTNVYVAYRIWYLYYVNPNSVTHHYNPQIISEVEQGLFKLEGILDFYDIEQRIGYFQHLIDELRNVYVCYFGHKNCNLKSAEKKKIISHFYNNEPWIKMKNLNIFKGLDIKSTIKIFFFNVHCYFLMLKIQNVLKK